MKKQLLPLLLAVPFCLTTGCNNQQSIPQKESNTMQETKTETAKRITTPSGLQYVLTKPSNNPEAKSPTKGQLVSVHYTGYLADANGDPIMTQKFDSSRDRNQPFEFAIGTGHVIKGWDEGVMDMKVGEQRRLIIPANLGYGSRAMGEKIPANSTLVFDVELLAVK